MRRCYGQSWPKAEWQLSSVQGREPADEFGLKR